MEKQEIKDKISAINRQLFKLNRQVKQLQMVKREDYSIVPEFIENQLVKCSDEMNSLSKQKEALQGLINAQN